MKKKHPILCTCLNQSPVWLTAGINCAITGCSPPALGPLRKVWRTCGVIVTNVPLNTYHWAVTTTKAVRSLTLLTGSRCHLYPNAPQVNDDLFVSGQGREGFPRLLVLINMHDAGRRNVCVCVCVTITCVYPAVTLYMITTGCAYVSITSGTLTHTSSWVFFFSLGCIICSWLYSPGPLFVLTSSMYCCFHLYIHAFHKAYVTRWIYNLASTVLHVVFSRIPMKCFNLIVIAIILFRLSV